GLEIDGDADVALAAQHVDADVFRMAPQHQVDARVADPQVLDANPRQEPRQHRLREPDLRLLLSERHAETGLKQHKHGAARPRLRQTGDRITRRPLAAAPTEAAEELREAALVQRERRVEQPFEQPDRLPAKTVTRKTRTDDRGIV